MNDILIRFVRVLHGALFVFVGILAGDTLARMLLLSWVSTLATVALVAGATLAIVLDLRGHWRADRYREALRRAMQSGRI